jgi:signal transduction histidine kinase
VASAESDSTTLPSYGAALKSHGAALKLLGRTQAALQEHHDALLQAEHGARVRAEQAHREAERATMRAEALQAVTSAFASALTIKQIGKVVTRQALSVLDATGGTLLLLTSDSDVLRTVARRGYPADVREQYRLVPLYADTPATEAVRTGEPVWIESASTVRSRFKYWSAHPTGHEALAALPLVVETHSVGALVVGFTTQRQFGAEDQAFLLTLAGQCAVAVHRVQLYQAAEAARAQAERALWARDEFLRALAHDLKTPLAGLVWHVQVLKKIISADARASEWAELDTGLEAIEASARELVGGIEELRDLVRMLKGGFLPMQRERIDLAALAYDVVSTYAQSYGRSLHVQGTDEPLVVQGDRPRLRRALGNVLANALKYSPADREVVIELERQVRGTSAWALVHVHGRGVGIPPSDLPFVFDRYRRGANVDSIPGKGIGLVSAIQLVVRHGGQITVHSHEGVGSTFTISLPLVDVV